MNIKKSFISLGMVSAIFFFLHDFIGTLLWKGYNPIRDYVSNLTADGAPHAGFLRIILYSSLICLALFTITLIVKSIKEHFYFLSFGSILLLLMVILSFLLFGIFPATLNFFNPQNLFHTVLTITIIVSSLISIFVIASGFLKQENKRRTGKLFLVLGILCFLFNLMHLVAILNGMKDILGLLERLSIYTLEAFIYILSWVYTFRDKA